MRAPADVRSPSQAATAARTVVTTQPPARRRNWDTYISVGTVILSLACLVGIWELVAVLGDMPAYELPTPGAVVQSLIDFRGPLLSATGVTAAEVAAGFGIAAAIALPSAIGIAYSRILDRILSPLLVASQAVPKVAVAPLFLLWFGFGELPKILIAAVVAFFPIVINGVVGLRAVDPDLIRMARVTRASPIKIFWKIRLPMAMPSLFGGLKVAITLSVIGAVVGEFVAGTSGLGYIVQSAQGQQETALAFAGLVLLTAMALVLYYLMEGIERWLIPE